jgi:hypothetical protein
MPCNLVGHCFGGMYRLHLQCQRVSQASNMHHQVVHELKEDTAHSWTIFQACFYKVKKNSHMDVISVCVSMYKPLPTPKPLDKFLLETITGWSFIKSSQAFLIFIIIRPNNKTHYITTLVSAPITGHFFLYIYIYCGWLPLYAILMARREFVWGFSMTHVLFWQLELWEAWLYYLINRRMMYSHPESVICDMFYIHPYKWLDPEMKINVNVDTTTNLNPY